MITSLQNALNTLHQKKPLILCLTNYVTMDFTANALLAMRAAPIMSESLAEIEELIDLSQALYINIGTINFEFMERVLFAADKAHSKKIPVILDPVGAGASFIRTSSSKELLHLTDIIRGNASEIHALGGVSSTSRGVEFS
jgi:hydroxyethylthiazole kinase